MALNFERQSFSFQTKETHIALPQFPDPTSAIFFNPTILTEKERENDCLYKISNLILFTCISEFIFLLHSFQYIQRNNLNDECLELS